MPATDKQKAWDDPITRPTFAINYFRCRRCERLMRAHGIADECYQCIDGAVRAWGLGPMCGEVSGT